ncbi:MAG: hypothetical protein SPI41_03865 [Prevotella sp.]|nr:hypothetical protein [Prevotella sp.]
MTIIYDLASPNSSDYIASKRCGKCPHLLTFMVTQSTFSCI